MFWIISESKCSNYGLNLFFSNFLTIIERLLRSLDFSNGNILICLLTWSKST